MKKLTSKTCKTVRLVYGIIFSAFTAVVGALFIWQTLKIYIGGKNAGLSSPFSREKVVEGLSVISVPFWVWIALIFVGFILWEVFSNIEKPKFSQDARYTLYCLKKKVSFASSDEYKSQMGFVKQHETILLILWLIVAAAAVAVAFGAIIYFVIPSHFPKIDINGEMLNMVKTLLPCVMIVFLLSCGVAVFEGYSAKKQIPYIKQIIKAKKDKSESEYTPHDLNYALSAVKRFFCDREFCFALKLGIRIGVGCLGVVFIIAGILNESVKDVFIKAINICTECIGLG